MDNDSTGFGAYFDEQRAAAAGTGGSDPAPDDAQAAVGSEQEADAPLSAETGDALSSDGVDPDGETASAPDPDGESSQASGDDDLKAELARIKADLAERDRKEQEAKDATERAETARRQQEQISQWDQQYAAFDEYESGLGQKAKALTAQVVNTLVAQFQSRLTEAEQGRVENGKAAAAFYTAFKARHPDLVEGVVSEAKAMLAMNSPEEMEQYIGRMTEAEQRAVAAKDKEIATLRKQIKALELEKQARGLTESNVLAVGSSGAATGATGASRPPANFSEWFDQQRAAAVGR